MAKVKGKSRKDSAERFVRVYQGAAVLEEVMRELGISRSGVRARARYYRKQGVPLKRLRSDPSSPRLDWAALAQMAERLAEGEAEEKAAAGDEEDDDGAAGDDGDDLGIFDLEG